jgi:flagellar M-ring protein FliF
VQAARVHLALPQQNGFFREQQKPSASVVLTLHPGRTLDRAQIAGIVHLVSGSVPELSPKAVSVVDGTGALLSEPGRRERPAGLDSQQLQYLREVEASHHKRVLALLEPVVGRDNLRATVTADIDFSQVDADRRGLQAQPGRRRPAAVREQRSEESSQPGSRPRRRRARARPTNQPPVPATAPINGPAQALQAAAGRRRRRQQRAASRDALRGRQDHRVTRNATGTVRRLNAAVVVNHRTSTDAKGKTTSTPLTERSSRSSPRWCSRASASTSRARRRRSRSSTRPSAPSPPPAR